MMRDHEFWVAGVPATFATAGERRWKAAIVAGAPRPVPGHEDASALSVEFVTPPHATGPRAQDIDNLMEPTFAALVGQLKWFAGRRPRITSWYATKRHGAPTGARVTILHAPVGPMKGEVLLEGVYGGPLPTCATSPKAGEWASRVAASTGWRPREGCGLELSFSRPKLNAGEIATGPVKAMIDCLYPWVGGVRGDPDDERVQSLLVRRGVVDVPGEVRVRLFACPTSATSAATAPTGLRTTEPTPEPTTVTRHIEANPCQPGTRLHVVFEAALRGDRVETTRTALEKLARGAGARLSEYLADLRVGHDVNIRIVDGRLRLLR